MALRRILNGERKSINQMAREKWRSSGLSDREAKKLHLQGLTAAQVAALGPNFHEAAALRIPYFDLQGRTTSFFRVRYLEPLPGFAGQLKKPDRFTQEIRALNEVYLPPLFAASWEEISKNVSLPLYITEGELKAAAGCAAKLATIGLGGVDVWRASKRGITFLPVLDKFVWKDRVVSIIYDSDLTSKPDVVRAQRQLSQELLSRGAEIHIINIPPLKDGGKQGLDDFLVNEGGGALQELIGSAVPFPESDALWGLNEEVVFIRQPDIVAERSTRLLMDPHRFMTHIYANRHYVESTEVGKGKNRHTATVKKQLAPHWLQWEHRSQVEKLVYEPGKPQGEWEGNWNTWPGWGVDPKKGDIGPWNWLMDLLFGDEQKMRRWFEKWCAYPLQHPGVKLYSAMLMWSQHKRIGKSLAFYSLMKIYGENAIEINNKSIKGDFNSWAENRQFVYANEIRGSEAKIDADWLKNIITSEFVTINRKHVPQFTTDNHMNHAFDSNKPDALFLDDDDKRFAVHESRAEPGPRDKYEWCDHWLHNSGPSALFYHLLDLPLGDFNPREHAPETPGKTSMILIGKNSAAHWVQLLKDDKIQALKPLEVGRPGIAAVCDLYTPTQLHRAFDPTGRNRTDDAALGRALAAGGFRQLNHSIPIRTRTMGNQRLYAIRNEIDWEQATRREIVDHFERHWASGDKGIT